MTEFNLVGDLTFYNSLAVNNSNEGMKFEIKVFSTGVVIPEPRWLAAGAALGVLGLMVTRRRR